MIRPLHCVAIVVLVASGCAGAPDREEANAPATASEPAALQSSGTPIDSAAPEPDLVVDINDLAARMPAAVTCREILLEGSNVIRTYCMTAENWKTYKRNEAQRAQETVRMLQGMRRR